MIHSRDYKKHFPNDRKPYVHNRTSSLHKGILNRGWTYLCPVTGIRLEFTNGRSKGAPKFYVLKPQWHPDWKLDSKQWRYGSRAWSDEEALDKALKSKKVQGWLAKGWQDELNMLIGLG